jgi:cysteine desulfurase/selenocysteine lyase
MIPSEPKQGPSNRPKDETWPDVVSAGKDVPAGLPDPAVLARLASEFFTSLPGLPAVKDDVLSSNAQPGLALVNSTSLEAPRNLAQAPPRPNGAELTEAELSALPLSLDQLSVFSNPSPDIVPAVWVPGVPVDLSEASSAAGSSYSFLEDARPLFGGAGAPFASASSSSTPPKNAARTESSTRNQNVPNAISLSGPAPVEAPIVPGSAQRSPVSDTRKSFQFLDEIRQLAPVDVVPVLEPLSAPIPQVSDLGLSSRPFELGEIRRDFPILQERVNGRPLVWLDNAATTQKPQSVIDRLSYFYAHENSNVHRAAHELAARSTDAYEGARDKVRRFLNASSTREIIFVRGATEGINLIAQSWGRQNIQKGDEIVITWLEHHANIVPWQMLCAEKGARLRVAPVDDSGQVLLDEYAKLLGPRTRLVSMAQVSNALGTVTPAQKMIEMAHHYGATVVLDGAQAVSHMPVDVQLLDCDLFIFSGHKVFAPTGIGVVYGKSDVLDRMPPWQGGGNMIADVTFEKTLYQAPPGRFEAGTGSIADAVGLGAAIDYIERIGMANIARYEHDLLDYATASLGSIPGLHIIGTAKEKAGVLSFVLDGFKTEDLGAALNLEGIAVRSGHHCAQPILRRFGLEATVRASLALYNTCEELDALVAAIWNLKQGRRPGLV